MYEQEDYLALSGIQHFAFCKRQWALIHVEGLWQENYHTAIGRVFHERAHAGGAAQKRGGLITARGVPVHSPTLGISGECDVLEFYSDKMGVKISGREGKYIPCPVEYKKGSPKKTEVDILQLAAQAMCLEEMFCCDIGHGYLFYGQTRHREKIEITQELKKKVADITKQMHELVKRGHTPKVKPTKSCDSCSLADLCLPVLCKNKSAAEYISRMLNEG